MKIVSIFNLNFKNAYKYVIILYTNKERMMKMFDVIVIGAGIIGCAVARELSKYNGRVLVIEKSSDVSTGTTKANSGIVHAGHDAIPGTLKAKYNVLGSKMYKKISKELDFPYENNGALVLGFDEDDLKTLKELKNRGSKNKVMNLEIISGDDARRLEASISSKALYALNIHSSAIVSPFEVCIAYAESAATNGVEFLFNTEVKEIKKLEDFFIVETENVCFKSKVIVNCAGLYADKFNNQVSKIKYHITPRRGDYFLFDKECGNTVKRTIFQCPSVKGKGVLVTKTVHGNLLVGPSSNNILDKEDKSTNKKELDQIWEKSLRSVESLNKKYLITEFSGIRAHLDGGDFVVGFSPDVDGFYNCLGIESPGLASAPAIAVSAANDIKKYLNIEKNMNFIAKRKSIPRVESMSVSELNKQIKKDKTYSHIICRCEVVSEGEIRESIRRKPGAKDLDGIKRRTRAGMGRCQSGFCTPKLMEILAEELGEDMSFITKKGNNSRMLVGKSSDVE